MDVMLTPDSLPVVFHHWQDNGNNEHVRIVLDTVVSYLYEANVVGIPRVDIICGRRFYEAWLDWSRDCAENILFLNWGGYNIRVLWEPRTESEDYLGVVGFPIFFKYDKL